jgi:hypothetical protein
MNQVTRNKILLTIISILLITNVVMLVLFLTMKPEVPAPKKLGFTEKLKKEVGFTPEQMAVFEPKKKAFWDNVRKRNDEIKKTKEEFYHFMYDPKIPDSVMEAKADVIGKQQRDLDMHVIRHFKEVRSMCTEKQLPKYDSLLPPLIERMTARPGSR